MGLGNSIKNLAYKAFNGGFTQDEVTMAKILNITPKEYHEAVAAEAIKTHTSPTTNKRTITLLNNSKYKPNGDKQEPGSVFNDYESKQGKAIVNHNIEVNKRRSVRHRSVTARMTGVSGPSGLTLA